MTHVERHSASSGGGTSTGDARTPVTLIVGLGNPLLGDDGVGWTIADAVRRELGGLPSEKRVEVDCLAVGGLALMERMVGYDRVILVDAMHTGSFPPGSVRRFPLEALPDAAAGHTVSAHDASLKTALVVGRLAGASLPREITVVAVESPHVYDFSEELTPPVAAALPLAVREVMAALGG